MPNERFFAENLRSRAASTFSGSYQTVGVPTVNPSFSFRLVNDTSVGVTVSVDGTNDKFYLPSETFLLLDLGTNGTPGGYLELSALTQFYVKATAGTGNFYVETYYSG